MATKTYFINSTQAAYTDEEFAWLQSLFLSEGIIGDEVGALGFEVTQLGTPGMGVQVAAGKALVEITKDGRTFKVVVESDAVANPLIAENSSGSNRIDAIVLRVDVDAEPNVSKSNIATIETVLGDGVSALSDGDIDTALGDDGWIRLADITVANGAVSILNASIADQRSKVQFNDAMGFGAIFIDESAGAADEGKVPMLNASGKLDDSFLDLPADRATTTYNSNTTYTVPAGVYVLLLELWGAGGGASQWSDGGGGGGGGYTRKEISVVPGMVLTLSIGNGGTVANEGGAGGNTSITINSISIASANGGGGGTSGGSGGSGGTGTTENGAAGNGGNAVFAGAGGARKPAGTAGTSQYGGNPGQVPGGGGTLGGAGGKGQIRITTIAS